MNNRLINETSPYLLQHAHNPVDWHAWGPEAFELARKLNKPIFLSVGYSTCYWCHVMERQCFENEAIAKEMNNRFINIKVDREERPDVDQLYMTAVQVMTHQGGWPMSVFLTPDLEPFYAGTYFPPTDMYGRPGFPRLLGMLESAYNDRPTDVAQTTTQLKHILQSLAQPRGFKNTATIARDMIDEIIDRSTSDYESIHGGFGSAPKFPRQTLLELLLNDQLRSPNPERMKMLLHTLDSVANGGIRDHLAGGFHRYSTDTEWLVPHFEIMLYDNAMLGWVYAEAFRQTKLQRYATVAIGIFDFTIREMTAPTGAFYTAFDAEVDAQEGLSYLWTLGEAVEVLTDTHFTQSDQALFTQTYGLNDGPNFADPHHGNGTPDKNILFLPIPLEKIAVDQKTTVEALHLRLAPMRQALLNARYKRKQPLLDTKILTSWNALMIRSLAFAGQVLNMPSYTQAADKAADFLMAAHRNTHGELLRTSRDGSTAKYRAFLDDYAFLADGLFQLGRIEEAKMIVELMLKLFRSDSGAFYFTDSQATDLIVRQIVGSDSPLPSGNGIAAKVLLQLGMTDAALSVIKAFASPLLSQGEGSSSLVDTMAAYIHTHGPIRIDPSQQPSAPANPLEIAARVVSTRTTWPFPTELHLHLTISNGFHIQSSKTQKNMIATFVNMINAKRIEYPDPTPLYLEFANETHDVYSGNILIKISFDEPPTFPTKLVLSYQACDDSTCLPTVAKTLEFSRPE